MRKIFNKHKIASISLVMVALLAGAVFFTSKAESNFISGNTLGFAWGGVSEIGGFLRGLGWLSFNNESSEDDQSYGVVVNSDGTITGYAWSPNFGYLRFGGFNPADMPDVVGSVRDNAKVLTNPPPPAGGDYQVVGWARFCAVFQNGCSGALIVDDGQGNQFKRGGWDGWVSLRLDGVYGVSVAPNSNGVYNQLHGYAWAGGLDNPDPEEANPYTGAGWISFNGSNYGVEIEEPAQADAIVQLHAEPSMVQSGQTTTLSWDIVPQNGAVFQFCTPSASVGGTGWDSYNPEPPTGSALNINVPAGPTIYSLTCVFLDGQGGGFERADDATVDYQASNAQINLEKVWGVNPIPGNPDMWKAGLQWVVYPSIDSVANCEAVAKLYTGAENYELGWYNKPGTPPPPVATTHEVLVPVTGDIGLKTEYKITCTDLIAGDGSTVSDSVFLNEGSFSGGAPGYRED